MTKRISLIVLICLSILLLKTQAQEDREQPLASGDAPRADRITVTENPDIPFTVIVSGTEHAVFPSAQVAIRNLYTGDTVYTTARFDGTFEAIIAGLPMIPFQIQTNTRFDQTVNAGRLSGVGVIIHPDPVPPIAQNIPFATGGTLSYGAGRWFADGTINQVNFQQNDNLAVSLDVTFLTDNLDPEADYQIRGHLALRRLFDVNGYQTSRAIGTGDDWSADRTITGDPILGQTDSDVSIATVETDAIQVSADGTQLRFTLELDSFLPSDLIPAGYVPIFNGELSINGSQYIDWYANRIFSADGAGEETTSMTILPMLTTYRNMSSSYLVPLAVNGIVSSETIFRMNRQQSRVADGSQIELIGFTEPYFVLPIQTESLRWTVHNIVDDLTLEQGEESSQIIIRDNRLLIEPPEDLSIIFDNLSDYTPPLSLTVNLVDRTQTQLSSSGAYYELFRTVDEIITWQPGLFSGTPLISGQSYPYVGTIYPTDARLSAFVNRPSTPSADVPQSGSVIPTINRFGYYYAPAEQFATSYNVNWIAIGKRHRGVVANQATVAHGNYGVVDSSDSAQAWFDTASYPADNPDVLPIVNFPFFAGDIVFTPDDDMSGVNPILTGGDYQYVSVHRADTTLDQFVRDSDATLARFITNETNVNTARDNRPDDVLWLFGSVVDAGDTAGYSSVAVVTDNQSARVVPPLTEPVTMDHGHPVDMFVLPTGVRAGQVLEIGDTFAMVGYVAPTVAADVTTTIQMPSETLSHTTQASPFGFFYQPAHDFTVTQAGIYTVYIDAIYDGETSAGQLADSVYGTVLGGNNGGFYVFVVDPESPVLPSNREDVSVVAPAQPFSIVLSGPADWVDVSTYFVVRTPQRILEQGQLDTFSNRATYTFDWGAFIRNIPNLGYSASDPDSMDDIIFSFAMTGTDADGNPRIQARVFTLRANTLYTQATP